MKESIVDEENVLLKPGTVEVDAEEPVLVVLEDTNVEDEKPNDVAAATLGVIVPELTPDDRSVVVSAELVKDLLEREVDKELCDRELVNDTYEEVEE